VALPLFRESFASLCASPFIRPRADKRLDARYAQGVFSDVHAAGKNDLILFRRSGGETLRGFLRGFLTG